MRGALLTIAAACSFKPGSLPLPEDGRQDGPVDDASADDAAVDAPADAVSIDAATCPATYTMSGTSRYRYVLSTVTWSVAEQDCEDDGFGTHLVVFASSGELTTVDALTSASQTWMGASDRVTSGTWLYVTGEAAPDLGQDNEARCAMWYDGTGGGTAALQDRACTDTAKAYVCECDLVEPDPSAF